MDSLMQKPVQLKDHQKEHTVRLIKILYQHFAYLDTSKTGDGKSFTTTAVAQHCGLRMLVVSPVSAMIQWKMIAKDYNVPIIECISYQKLRGTKKGCTHPYLNRTENTFRTTEAFSNLVQSKILLVLDEIHNIKNGETAQLMAVHTLVKEICRLNCGSRIAALSATPFDKEEHVTSILKATGIILGDELYHYDHSKDEYRLTGFNELVANCKMINNHRTGDVLSWYPPMNNRSIKSCAFRLFADVIKPAISSSMPPREFATNTDAKNGFYVIDHSDIELMTEGEKYLHSGMRENDNGDISVDRGGLSKITKGLTMIEKAKLKTMARLAKSTLDADLNCKVVLYVYFIDSINTLMELLSAYSPVKMYGTTKQDQRVEIISNFQKPNCTSRLLITNPRVGGVGISLDDTDGNYKRYMFAIPSYYFIEAHQAAGRFNRTNTKSDSIIRFVYSHLHRGELQILDAIARKTKVTKSVLYDTRGVTLPGDYPSYEETATSSQTSSSDSIEDFDDEIDG